MWISHLHKRLELFFKLPHEEPNGLQVHEDKTSATTGGTAELIGVKVSADRAATTSGAAAGVATTEHISTATKNMTKITLVRDPSDRMLDSP